MHAKETQVMPGAQSRNNKTLFRLGGRGLFQNLGNLIQPFRRRHPASTDSTKVGEFGLVGGLYRTDRTGLRRGQFNQLARATAGFGADIQMVTHQQQKGFPRRKVAPARHRVAVAPGISLLDEPQPLRMTAGRRGIHALVARLDHHPNLFHPGRQGFLDDDAQGRLGGPIAIDQGLQGQRTLIPAGGRDEGFSNLHQTREPSHRDPVPESLSHRERATKSNVRVWSRPDSLSGLNTEPPLARKEKKNLGLLALLVAAMTGAASAFFLAALDFVTGWRWNHPAFLALLPLIGLALVLGYRHWGQGTDRGSLWVVEELRGGDRPVPARLAPAVLLATLLTHLGGGSAGREGTAVQMGAGIAAAVEQWTGRSSKTLRHALLLAGVSAGFGSVFGTPWAGAIFALEIQLTHSILDFRPTNRPAIWPLLRWFPLILIAAWTGHGVCLACGSHHTPYPRPVLPDWPTTLLAAAGVGVAAGLAARTYVAAGEGLTRACLKGLPTPWLRPVFGAALLLGGSLLLGTDAYLGLGVSHPIPTQPSLLRAFETAGVSPWSWLWKLGFTAITLSTGFKGGEVTPLLFVGAALGNALAGALGIPLSVAASVGTVAVFAAASRTPLACTVMGMELFGLASGPALLVGCGLAFAVVGSRGIYTTHAQR